MVTFGEKNFFCIFRQVLRSKHCCTTKQQNDNEKKSS